MSLLLMCRLTVEKGVRIILQAMRELPEDVAVELVIAGKGPLEAEVSAAAEQDQRIRFAGFVQGEAKEALLTGADHLLIPSLWYRECAGRGDRGRRLRSRLDRQPDRRHP